MGERAIALVVDARGSAAGTALAPGTVDNACIFALALGDELEDPVVTALADGEGVRFEWGDRDKDYLVVILDEHDRVDYIFRKGDGGKSGYWHMGGEAELKVSRLVKELGGGVKA